MQKNLLLTIIVLLLTLCQAGAQCLNRCLDFDPLSPGDYVQPSASPLTGDANFTIEARFLCTSTGTNSRRLFALSGTNSRYEIAESAGVLRLVRQTVGNGTVTVNLTSTNVRDGQWHHLAAVRNGTAIRVYLDGTLIYGLTTFTGTLALTTFRIGGSVLSVGGNFQWDGLIDEVRVWNVERSVAQINAFRLCWASCPSIDLRAYYHFNQGIPSGSNPNETTLTDCTGQFNASLFTFTLNGTNSNWVCNTDAAFNDALCCPASFVAGQDNCGTLLFTNQTVGNYSYLWDFGDGTTSTLPNPSHTYTANGVYTVTLTATPLPSGSPCSVQQTLSINSVDNQAPTLLCKDINVILSGTSVSIIPEDVLLVGTDNCCQNVALSLVGQTVYTCVDACQTRTVTLVGVDCNGNSNQCTVQVTVTDPTGPVIFCNDMLFVSVGLSGSVTLDPLSILEGGVMDNCPNGVTLSVTPASLLCPANGCNETHIVRVTAMDCAGKTTICFSQVTVQDKLPPMLACPANTTVFTLPAICHALYNPTLSLTDNCDADPEVSFVMSGSTNAGGLGTGGSTPMNLGVTQIVLTAKDACGNTSTCMYKITVQDAIPPTLLCPPSVSLTGSITAGGGIAIWPPVITIDDCGFGPLVSDHTSGDFFPCGVTLVQYTAADQSGNTSICSFTVTVNCVNTCTCGQFSNLTFSQNGSTALPFKCGDFLPVTCPVVGSTLTLSGNFSCVGDTTCLPQNFQFVNSDGTPIGSGSLSGNVFIWSFGGFYISNPGWYELYLQSICGGDTCRCPVRFTVPDCPPTPPCDQVSAEAKPVPPVPGQPQLACCHDIVVNNTLPNLATSINLQVISGGSLLFSNVSPAAGWSIAGFVGNTSVMLAHSSGQVPVGSFICGRICLTALTASPQVLEVQYLDANGKVVCVDRLTLECNFCVSIEQEDFVCDPAARQLTMTFCVSIPISNTFSANSLVLTGPTGVVFSPAAFPLPNVPPGGSYCSLSTTISVPSGTLPDSLCIMFTAHQKDVTAGFPPGECCMIKECYDLPDCCPNFATATAVDSTDGHCCWKITLNQPPATSQFVTLNVIPVPGSPVIVQAIAPDPNWYFNMAPGQQSLSFAPVPLAPLPALSTLPSICFQVPSGSPVPQLLEVVWSGSQQNVLCRDTLELFCQPDTDCVAVMPTSLLCDPSVPGQSVYTLVLTHPFGSTLTATPTHVALVDVAPASAVVGTGIYPLGSFPPGSTVLVPITLQGTPGTQVCFALNLYSNPSPNIFLDCCVTEDTFCVMLPNCSLAPRVRPVSMYPNPADEAFTLDFGETGSPAQGRMLLRDVAGRLLWEEKIPVGTLRHEVPLPAAGAGVFIVEFLENNSRVWIERLSVVK